MRNLYPSLVTIVLAMSAAALSSPSAVAQQATHDHARKQLSSKPDLKFLHGAPTDAADSWALSSGGRMYDNWWEALGRAKPKATHRAYPTSGEDTWTRQLAVQGVPRLGLQRTRRTVRAGVSCHGDQGDPGCAGPRPQGDRRAAALGPSWLHNYDDPRRRAHAALRFREPGANRC